ncbi:hypothetical protein DL96DRAFT_1817182 [Flagelloscypha sp. PMI_526]|nr:hypothetical protein DL96DRAFT_1817182 [Flagelloscypha sp. PMI_526]
MLLSTFPRFLELPSEIQGIIWRIATSSVRSHSERARLLLISRSCRIWVQDIVYHTIHAFYAQVPGLALSVSANHEVFALKTKRLWLGSFTNANENQIITLIPAFQGLISAAIISPKKPFGILKSLLALPRLTELHLSENYSAITADVLLSLEGSPSTKTVIHLFYICTQPEPPHALLRLFPKLKTVVITSNRRAYGNHIQSWLEQTQPSFRVLALLDMQRDKELVWERLQKRRGMMERRADKEQLQGISMLARHLGKNFGIIQVTGRSERSVGYWDSMDRIWGAMMLIEEGATWVDIHE